MTDIESAVCYRKGPLTVRDYDEAITDLLAAKHALQRGESGGCDVCGSDEHWPSECDHNPLRLARSYVAARLVWQCWHCGYEARTEAEAVSHFGRTDNEAAACIRAKAKPLRGVDGLEAMQLGNVVCRSYDRAGSAAGRGRALLEGLRKNGFVVIRL